MENRIFFPQAALDEWVVGGTADLQDGELTIVRVGRRYRLAEAVHILRDASGGGDPDLIGRVKARVYLEQIGAEIVETSMLLGDAAYDVAPGWVGVPTVGFADFMVSSGSAKEKSTQAKSDEDLLAELMSRTL